MTVNFQLLVDGILGEFGAAVIDKKDPKVTFTGWGSETSHAMFRPLHHSLTVNIGYVDKIDTSDLGLTPEVQATINQHVAKLSVDNHAKAEEACNGLFSSYCKLYKHMSGFTNFTINSVCVYLSLYSVSDLTPHRLVRSKSIFQEKT